MSIQIAPVLSLGLMLSFSTQLLAASETPPAMQIPASSTSTPTDTTDKNIQPSPHSDNSSRNQIHDGEHAVTADQQSNDKGDIDISRKIRRSVVKDKSLSTYAHNVKIITVNGGVVLKGPVRNNEEKLKIERIAKNIAGDSKVLSEIEVKHR